METKRVLWLDCHNRTHWMQASGYEPILLPFLPPDTNGPFSVFYRTPDMFLDRLNEFLFGVDMTAFEYIVLGNNNGGGEYIAELLQKNALVKETVVVWNDAPGPQQRHPYEPLGITKFTTRMELAGFIGSLPLVCME